MVTNGIPEMVARRDKPAAHLDPQHTVEESVQGGPPRFFGEEHGAIVRQLMGIKWSVVGIGP